MGPKFNESPYMKEKRHRKGDIKIEAEIEMMCLQTKESQGFPQPPDGRKHGTDST